jgi:hypothetical protein
VKLHGPPLCIISYRDRQARCGKVYSNLWKWSWGTVQHITLSLTAKLNM